MATITKTEEVGSLIVSTIEPDEVSFEMNKMLYEKSQREAARGGLNNQSKLAANRLSRAQNYQIACKKYPQVLNVRATNGADWENEEKNRQVDSSNGDAGNRFVTVKNVLRSFLFWEWHADIERDYHATEVHHFNEPMPPYTLQAYTQADKLKIFDRIEIWKRGAVYEKDPYVIGVIDAVTEKDLPYFFLITSWEEEDPMP